MGTTFIISSKGPDFLKLCEVEIFTFTHFQRSLVEYQGAHIFNYKNLYPKKDLEKLHDGYILSYGLKPNIPPGCAFFGIIKRMTYFNIQLPELPDNYAWEIFNVAIQTKKIENMIGDQIVTQLQWGINKLSRTMCNRYTIIYFQQHSYLFINLNKRDKRLYAFEKEYYATKKVKAAGQMIYTECPYPYAKTVSIIYERKGEMNKKGFGLCEILISGEKIC
ncbi:unnamed protein product [Gordionus sp. m RMFG-2023]|uniref:uncharacterized protein LOC135922513 n=1 Tax=Gordionus sp. m RMFG-2023 TaxID=3053472 RepID=UPI0030E28700